MAIRDKCSRIDIKIPVRKHHHIEGLDNDKRTKGIHFCPKHDTNILEIYCDICNEMLCTNGLHSHNKHVKQSTDARLKELNVNMEKYIEDITSTLKQAHKVCVGQNELVMSLFEVFDLYLALK
jgi:hypothetical protein